MVMNPFVPTIIGTGSYHPPRAVTNHDLESLLGTSDAWIRQRTGIEQRYFCEDKDATSDLALAASQMALTNAGIEAKDLDMILCATVTPDHEFPGTVCFLQNKLGANGIPAIDVRQACSGFLFGLSIALQYIKTGAAKRILLAGAEIHSKCLDLTPRGREIAVLFGDGAGAIVLEAKGVAPERVDRQFPEVLSVDVGCDGSHAKTLWVPAPGTGFDAPTRLSQTMMDEGLQFPRMNGRAVFVNAVETMTAQLKHLARRHNMAVQDFDQFVIHQANQRIADAVAQQLDVPPERFFNTIHKYGNTTAASIPLGLHDAVKAGALRPGMNVAFASFGAGFTWGTALVRW